MNNTNLKKIVSKFTKIPIEDINDNTVIDNTVIRGSILFHRMISKINELYDVEIDSYDKIKNYEDLVISIQKQIEK